MAFKMKGSPMQRNYGIGGPMNKNGNPEATADPKVGSKIAEWGYITGSINKKNKTIKAEDGSDVDMTKATRDGKTLWQHLLDGTI
tara:strand:- start:122 stop:376 length:255 start_codon:yes stop_codon:yes gene_type:complete